MPQKSGIKSPDQIPNELEGRVSKLETKMSFLLTGTGVTLVVVVGVSFWFGSLLGTINVTTAKSSEKVDKVYQVVWENKDSLAIRATLVESKLETMDKKLTDLTTFRERTSVKVRHVPEPTPSPK
jgi:hypothetical protein